MEIIITGIKVEPYWNVNTGELNHLVFYISIKVEPYWNVNQINGMKLKIKLKN